MKGCSIKNGDVYEDALREEFGDTSMKGRSIKNGDAVKTGFLPKPLLNLNERPLN